MMPQTGNRLDQTRNTRNQRRRQIRRRRRMIGGGLFALVILVCSLLTVKHFNSKNSPSGAITSPSVPPTAAISTRPTVTPSPEPSKTPQPTVIPSSPSPAAGAGTAGQNNLAKPLSIKVSIAKQTVTVFDSNNLVIKSFVCSTGLDGADTETPTGTYKVAERGESFFSQTYQEGAYYWTQFYGDYLFHSVPFDKNREIETVEAAKLGTKASHGCVRLTIENAKWIYDNIPRGTTVVIE